MRPSFLLASSRNEAYSTSSRDAARSFLAVGWARTWWMSTRSNRAARSTSGPRIRITAIVPAPIVAPSSQPPSAPPPWMAL